MTLLLSGTDGLSDVDGTAATPAIRGTDANTGMFFPAADTIAFSEGGVEALRLNANANLILQGGNTSASGVGVTFPATQVASSNANTLDDYEEGTFQPSWQSTGASFTYDTSYRHGRYTKIGNTVYFSIYISTSGAPTGTTSNNLVITGLPFISGDTDFANVCGCSYGLLWNVDWPVNKIMANVYVPRNSAFLDLFWEQDSTTSVRWTASNLLASCYIVVTGFYFV